MTPDVVRNRRAGVAVRYPQVCFHVAQPAKAELLAVYLDRRPALVRFFTARTGSADRAEDIVQDIYVRLQAIPLKKSAIASDGGG